MSDKPQAVATSWLSTDADLPARIVSLMESVLAADPSAAHALVLNRVECNGALADHPSVVVFTPYAETKPYWVGLLGVLNGLLPANKRVMAKLDERQRLVGFGVIDPTKEQET